MVLPGPSSKSCLNKQKEKEANCKHAHANEPTPGPVVRVEPNKVYLLDKSDWQQIVHVKEEFFKSPEFYWALHPGIFNVFTTVDPSVHRRYRRLLWPGMSESGLKEFYPQVEPKFRAVVAALDDEMRQRGAVDMLN